MAANLVLSWNHRLGAPGDLGPLLGDRPFDWPSVLFIELATVSVVALGWLMHRQAAISRDLAQRNAELERLRAVEAQQVVAEERTRIARELHDVVAHHLTAVIIRAQAADRVRDTRPEVASESIGWIAETAKEALTAMRGTVRVLRADSDAADLAPEPTLGDLRAIAARVGEAGLDIELRLPEPLPDLDPQVELAAVRIAQEALTNAMRHAGARRVVVTLRCDADGVVVDVDDDGTSGPPSERRHDGNGLVGMQERAAACGGRLRIGTSPLGGWRIQAWLPTRAAWS
jgi:signal transduction histidine kinase